MVPTSTLLTPFLLLRPSLHGLFRDAKSVSVRARLKRLRPRNEVNCSPVPPLQVGGSLSCNWKQWRSLGVDPYIILTPCKGYCIPFHTRHPLSASPSKFPSYRLSSSKYIALQLKVLETLDKNVLEIFHDPSPGFCSFLSREGLQGLQPNN